VPLEKVASFFVLRRLPKPPLQSVVHDDTRVIRPSVGNTGGTEDSVATDGPHRPTVWLKTLDFTGQGAGRHSNGVIFSLPIETRQAPRSHRWPSPADGWLSSP